MDEKFTPGPWRTNARRKRRVTTFAGILICDAELGTISDSVRPASEAEANANLIAAAPEMYAALIEARDRIRDHDGCEEPPAVLATIRAALSKARGDTR